jgi:hypothetical protein
MDRQSIIKKSLSLTAIITPIILGSYIEFNSSTNLLSQKNLNPNTITDQLTISSNKKIKNYKFIKKKKDTQNPCMINHAITNLDQFYQQIKGKLPAEIIDDSTTNYPAIDCVGLGQEKQSCIYWNINDTYRKYTFKKESNLEFITCKEVKKRCPIECKKTTYLLNESWIIVNTNLTQVISYGKNAIRSASSPNKIISETSYP